MGQFMREGLDRASLNANGRLCAGAGCRSVNMPHRTLKCYAKILHKRFHKFGLSPPFSLFDKKERLSVIHREFEAILDIYKLTLKM